MSFLTVTLNPALSAPASVETDAYTVATVTGVAPRNGSPQRRDNRGRPAQGQARRDPSATVPSQTTRGQIRDILV